MGHPKCAVPSCSYRRKKNENEPRSMYRVPKDELRALKWAYHVPGIDVLTPNQYLCEKHFEDRYIKRYQEKTAYGLFQRSRLTFLAVPTIFDTENQDVSNFNRPYEIPTVSDIPLNRSRVGLLESIACNQTTSVETTLHDIVKDLSASEKILMQIKQEEFPPCEDGVVRIKSENTEDAFKMESDELMDELTPFEQLQKNFFQYIKKLPDSWSVTQLPVNNDVIFAFSKECPVKDGLSLVVMNEKNIVLNRNGNMHYSIHGKTLVINNPDIPNVLKDIESLTDIITKFNELKVCQGISSKEFEVDKDCTSYKDDLGFYRHVNCTLVSDLVQCDSCYSYSQYLLSCTVHNSVNNSVLSNDSVYYHSPIY